VTGWTGKVRADIGESEDTLLIAHVRLVFRGGGKEPIVFEVSRGEQKSRVVIE